MKLTFQTEKQQYHHHHHHHHHLKAALNVDSLLILRVRRHVAPRDDLSTLSSVAARDADALLALVRLNNVHLFLSCFVCFFDYVMLVWFNGYRVNNVLFFFPCALRSLNVRRQRRNMRLASDASWAATTMKTVCSNKLFASLQSSWLFFAYIYIHLDDSATRRQRRLSCCNERRRVSFIPIVQKKSKFY